MADIRIFFFILFILISYYDFRYRIIPDRLLVIFLLINFINSTSLYNIYLGSSIYSFPLFLIWLLEEHIEIELIGLGDIKLSILIGMYRGYFSIYEVYNYYLIVCFLSLLYILVIKILGIKDKYIPFAPMLLMGVVIMGL